MTDDSPVLRLAPDCVAPLVRFLASHRGEAVHVVLEPERSLGALEAQALLAAAADPAGPSRCTLGPGSDRLRASLRLLGLEDRIVVAG